MLETVVRVLPVRLTPSELSPEMDEIVWNKVKTFEGKHIREEKKVITRIHSLQSIENTNIDGDTGMCLFRVSVICDQYTLSLHERISLPVKSQDKNGLYFQYGPFDLFLPNDSLPQPQPSVPLSSVSVPSWFGMDMMIEITSIRFSDISHRYIVVVKPIMEK